MQLQCCLLNNVPPYTTKKVRKLLFVTIMAVVMKIAEKSSLSRKPTLSVCKDIVFVMSSTAAFQPEDDSTAFIGNRSFKGAM